MRPTVIFDFDGTLALGDGPIEAYARGVAEFAGIPAIAEAAQDALAAFGAGEGEAIDGYDAVRTAALALGADEAALSAGYMASREHLATRRAPIQAPDGLHDFLTALAEHADLVLVTNSPDIRIAEALEVLGASAIARRVCSARKPGGLVAVIDDALAHGPVMSVGDVYANDLEPASARGAATALVGSTWEAWADRVTLAAATLPELYPSLEAWAATAAAASQMPSGTGTPQERHQ
ncbi:haloacid dehalogenase-like hydrolase [Demequina capsici]|uniref:Haloacid dehalogenase-like hydrolase n=1 Tax=Demequina capsici TaxID=3075620 RepID=A0AA96FEU9_9MICO|nr:haloacid dehalogenase-like hydrolase [Demequina sp. PMTSA13]WNM28382.1 haloacid dehalogenase-like hydrolase [Demequina sp. PMTSA13]